MSTLRRTSGIVPEMSVSGIPETDISGIYQKRYLTFLVYTRIAGEYSGNVYFSYSHNIAPCGRMLSFSQQLCHLHSSIAVEL